MRIPFVKMQGIGNDFILVDSRDLPAQLPPERLAVSLCDRHFGIGADGLIVRRPSERADCRMELINSDGSPAQMCGNGIRCLAKLEAVGKSGDLAIETDAGLKKIHIDGETGNIRVSMGRPVTETGKIPVRTDEKDFIARPLEAGGKTWIATCISMGNPHCVIFVDDLEAVSVSDDGSAIENAGLFPEKINVHFVKVLSPRHLEMKIWERGAGMTLGCGTGACAVYAAASLLGKTEEGTVTVSLPGGDLKISASPDGELMMEGPARTVFRGVYESEI